MSAALTLMLLTVVAGLVDAFFLKRYNDAEVQSFDANYGGVGGYGSSGDSLDPANYNSFVTERRKRSTAGEKGGAAKGTPVETAAGDAKTKEKKSKAATEDDSLAETSSEDFFDELSNHRIRVKRSTPAASIVVPGGTSLNAFVEDDFIEASNAKSYGSFADQPLKRDRRSLNHVQETFEIPNDEVLTGTSSEEERKFVARSVRPTHVLRPQRANK